MSDEELRPGQDPELEATVRAYLADHSVVTLAVSDAAGPWAAAVFFAAASEDGFDFHFVTSARTRHGAALLADARCAATVQEHPAEFRAIRGVQLAGSVAVVPPERAATAFEGYARKFPFVRALYRVEEQAYVIGGKRVEEPFWRFSTRDVYWIDNAYGFGRRRHIGGLPAGSG